MSEANVEKELRIIFPPTKTIQLRDGEELKDFQIKPFKTKQLVKVLNVFDTKDFVSFDSERDLIMTLLSKHIKELFELLGDVIGKSPEWVEDLYIDDLVLLGKTVLEVNVDFFNRTVTPTLKK